MRIGTGAAGGSLYRELGVMLGGGRVRFEHSDLLLELHDVGSERLTSQWERSNEKCSGSDLGLHPERRGQDSLYASEKRVSVTVRSKCSK